MQKAKIRLPNQRRIKHSALCKKSLPKNCIWDILHSNQT